MSAVIALIGRPNVGKSTLFNCLTRSQAALVADHPGLTRDRQFGIGKLGAQPYIVVDTGGLTALDKSDDIFALMQKQVHIAVSEADIILLLVDARAGLTPDDSEIVHYLRTVNKPVYLVINKADGMDIDTAMLDFYSLGMAQAFVIAASHGRGVAQMMDTLLASASINVPQITEEEVQGVCVAVLGRPNVGKSTLVNRILGEERVLTFNAPGTTRDSIYIPFEKNGQSFTLVDTAGIRRRSKTHAAIEKFSVIKALQAIDAAHVVILVLDAQEGVTDQDMHLLGRILEQGRALLIAVNKWDGLAEEQREHVKNGLARKLSFIDFAETFFISALHGSNVGLLLDAVVSAYRSAYSDFSTAQLTNLLEEALIVHQPPLVKGRRIKLRYAHQGGKNPPLIVIHGNQTEYLPEAYRRYLARHYQQRLKLQGTPVRIEVKTSHNPYRNRRNKLTPRQLYRKKRLLRHVKKQK